VLSTPRDPAAGRLRTAANRLVNRVEHWTAKRWALPATPAEPGSATRPAEQGTTRAETVHALLQRLADLAAGIEGRPPQAVPRLSNDLALPDQVRVMVADLQYIGGDEVLRAAAADIDATAACLG
jgi:hypothetical protein